MIIFRTELKYFLPLQIYQEFRSALIPFMEKDPHTKEKHRAYDVHSIYFDSKSMDNYNQKIEGEDEREKFRIRFYKYSDYKNEDLSLFVELKQKRGPVIKKLRYQVKESEFSINGLNHPDVSSKDSGHQLAILQNYHLKKLRPVVKVSYKREALVCPFGSDLRITFDGEITGAYSPSFHTKAARNEKMLLNPLLYLLEIKTADAIPTWLNRLIKRYNLESVSYSKYGKGIENCSIIERQ